MTASYTRILVTGGAGFIGCNFVRHVLQTNPDTQIVNLDALTYAGHLINLDDVYEHPNHTFVRGDICDSTVVRDAMQGCDAVVNIAAETHVDRSIHDSGPFVRTNVLGTQVLLDCAHECHIRKFVHVSTDEVYGSLRLDDEARFVEESPLQPRSPYAASKAAADLLVLSYGHTYGLPVCVTRCSNNYGPFQYPEKIIPLFVCNLLQGKTVPLYGDGLNVRDWIHVQDHVEAIVEVLERGLDNEIYNIGADNEQSNVDLTHQLLACTGRDESFIEPAEDRLGHDRRYAVDASKMMSTLDWKPIHSDWPTTLAETVAWYKNQQEWCETVRQEM